MFLQQYTLFRFSVNVPQLYTIRSRINALWFHQQQSKSFTLNRLNILGFQLVIFALLWCGWCTSNDPRVIFVFMWYTAVTCYQLCSRGVFTVWLQLWWNVAWLHTNIVVRRCILNACPTWPWSHFRSRQWWDDVDSGTSQCECLSNGMRWSSV